MRFVLLIFWGFLSLSSPAQAEEVAQLRPPETLEEIGNTGTGAFFLLGPNRFMQNTLHGICKQITNHTDHAIAYIPIGENTWPDFDSRTDQNGNLVIEVKPCTNPDPKIKILKENP